MSCMTSNPICRMHVCMCIQMRVGILPTKINNNNREHQFQSNLQRRMADERMQMQTDSRTLTDNRKQKRTTNSSTTDSEKMYL